MALSFSTLALTFILVVSSASAKSLPTSVDAVTGSGLLSLCRPCRYDAQCTSCKCIGHFCKPESDPHFRCYRPNCEKCKYSASCQSKLCFRGICVSNEASYYHCPRTRPYCYPCTKDSTCITGKCVKDRCAFGLKDYYAKCPRTRPPCAECRNSNQCREGLMCYRNKCVSSKTKYYDCPGTRGRCAKCYGKSYLCSHRRKCLSGVCAKDQDEVNACIKCCFFDKCSRKKRCVSKNGFFYDECKKKYYKYDLSCKRTIHKCCYHDACSGKRKCFKPNGLFDDTCGAQYKVRHDCKLIQTRKEHLCCYSDKCFVTGLNVKKKCVKKGGELRDTCGGVYKVQNNCGLKRLLCCYKINCAHQTYCRKVGAVIEPPCGKSFKVLPNCRMGPASRQLFFNSFFNMDTSSRPELVPLPERIQSR